MAANDTLTVAIKGRIDSGNAADIEKDIQAQIDSAGAASLVLDAEELEYISSAGLRVILRFRKKYPDLRVTNVNSEVYEIFDMTGFNQMMKVEKAYKEVSIEGCEEIGKGANGTIYRIDKDNVVKVYNNADALEDIEHEREVARLALILGIPTAISYDVVKVGNSYGSVFELLNAKSFAKILANEPERFEWCAEEFVEMLKKIHGTEVPKGKLPSIKAEFVERAGRLKGHLPDEYSEKLIRLINEIPEVDRMIHGDYHTKNLELQDDEVLIIDMDTLAVGHPVFELGSIFNAFIGFFEVDTDGIESFQGFSAEIGRKLWRRTLELYLGTEDDDVIRSVEDKARIIGYTRLIARSAKRGLNLEGQGKAEYEIWIKNLKDLLDRTETLVFDPKTDKSGSDFNEIDIEATTENLPKVLEFIDRKLESAGCPFKTQMQIDVAAEEIFVNIAKYAYKPDTGRAKVRVEIGDDPLHVVITFIDHGIPYDPLAKEDPNVKLSAEERQIGGLGIFLVKNTMDDISYQYINGSNILTLKKNL